MLNSSVVVFTVSVCGGDPTAVQPPNATASVKLVVVSPESAPVAVTV